MTYSYKMGITVSGVKIPDASVWNYEVADLDTEAARDATGYLHRNRVATKINYEFEWNALEWEMLDTILNAVDSSKFTLVAPDPRTFNTEYRGEYYVGNRSGKNHYYWEDTERIALYSLKLKFIEY